MSSQPALIECFCQQSHFVSQVVSMSTINKQILDPLYMLKHPKSQIRDNDSNGIVYWLPLIFILYYGLCNGLICRWTMQSYCLYIKVIQPSTQLLSPATVIQPCRQQPCSPSVYPDASGHIPNSYCLILEEIRLNSYFLIFGNCY